MMPAASRQVPHSLWEMMLIRGNDEYRRQQSEDINLATARARQNMILQAQLNARVAQGRVPGTSTSAAMGPAGGGGGMVITTSTARGTTPQSAQPIVVSAGGSQAAAPQPSARDLQNDRIQSQERMQTAELANRLAQQNARTQGQKELNQQNSDLEEQRRRAALERALAVVNATRGGGSPIRV